MALLNFDATEINPQSSLDPVPTGWYNCMITDSDLRLQKMGRVIICHLNF